jgi:hypothetical protein
LHRIIANLLVLITTTFCTAQSRTITVRFIGNCSLHMSDGLLDVNVDFPYKSGAYGYMIYPRSEINSIKATHIFTHRHPDHDRNKLVKKLNGVLPGPWKVKKWPRDDLSAPAQSAAPFALETFSTKHRFARHHYIPSAANT